MSELTGPGVSTCERHKSRASRQKSGRRRPMRRQSGFLAGNGERGPNLTAIFHPPVFPQGLKDLCTMQHLLLLPLPITFFVKVSGAIAVAHIICREPFKALVAELSLNLGDGRGQAAAA